ncbi:glutathione transferase GstA [Terasakiella sp. A23]|uniref:glutathione transferase GstA n=1 Tax=Terasakiella sp. FCG-A23 TaxID=3080561 RepID=UPI002953D91D|nr:glutathione transferase GstA [Terasakiella sp. A23]MDV7340482.1 glutathione transferase GstA [Terasakiella sp. A23]
MKLYFKPGACSLASHIILNEIGLDHQIEQVDTDTKQTQSGQDYLKINPKGYVPALELETGEVLSEGASILQYLAEQGTDFYAPKSGTIEKARIQEHLNYTASELHKAFGPFFSAAATDADKEKAGKQVATKFDYVESLLADGRDYLLGQDFSVADAYLFVVSNWANFVNIDLANWPNLSEFVQRVAGRAATQKAMAAEGLV